MSLDSTGAAAPRVRLLSKVAASNNARIKELGAAFERARAHRRRCFAFAEKHGRPSEAEVAAMKAAYFARGGTVRPWLDPDSTGPEQADEPAAI